MNINIKNLKLILVYHIRAFSSFFSHHIYATEVNIKKCDIHKVENTNDDECIVSAVVNDMGEVIAACSGGKVMRINNNGKQLILYVEGAEDWRALWKDSKGNVFISPHSTPSLGSININQRGIYKLSPDDKNFRMVLSLYNPTSNVAAERVINDDTIWTFCEDSKGNLYAGVYAHTLRNNPAIYKSTDNGDTWEYIFNFNDAGITNNGKHIHGIVYSKTDDSLYAIVGEINELYKSSDGGYNWSPLGIKTELAKGSALLAVNDGIIIGSDSAYDCIMSKYYFYNKRVKTTSRLFGNTIFAIRESDLTGNLYAFGKIDSSVKLSNYYPPIDAITNKKILSKWLKTHPQYELDWRLYNKRMQKKYPEDSIRPQHIAILISEDKGETWKILYSEKTTSKGPNGFWTTGFFHKGECLTGYVGKSLKYERPIVLNENSLEHGILKHL